MIAGEIWLADILFTDGSASKIRPVLVFWVDAVVAVVTSAAPSKWGGTITLSRNFETKQIRATTRRGGWRYVLATKPE
jgi:hypothetical protein